MAYIFTIIFMSKLVSNMFCISCHYKSTVPCLLCLSNFFHSFNEDKKIYADAQETWKTGRLVEPKTKSFNDKVYAETNIVFGQRKPTWIGISAKGGSHDPQPWVYTSSGTEIFFENWHSRRGSKIGPKLCAFLMSRSNPVGQWSPRFCNIKRYELPFICEFV